MSHELPLSNPALLSMGASPAEGKVAGHAPTTETLRVVDLAIGGESVSRRPNGQVVFVPGALPGDVIEVRIVEQRRDFARGRLLRVLSPSPRRVLEPCPHARRADRPEAPAEEASSPVENSPVCGGCTLMPLPLPDQLAAKETWIKHALRRHAPVVLPMLAPTPSEGYRLRARLVVRDGQLSYAEWRSSRGVPISSCLVLEPALARVLFGPAQRLVPLLTEGSEVLGLYAPQSSPAAVQLAVRAAQGTQLAPVRQALQALIDEGILVGATLREATNVPFAPAEVLGQALLDLGDATRGPLPASAEGFAQASAAGHTLLPDLVQQAIMAPLAPHRTDGKRPRILELYSGSGNLSRALLPLAEQLVCVEGDVTAVARAKTWGTARNLHFLALPAEVAMRRLVRENERFDVVVLDPPRTGARDVIGMVPFVQPQQIIYVSCDAMTLARDLDPILRRGYVLRSVQPVDLMPHTPHVETLTLLERPPGTPPLSTQ